jgi:hypothetical protein
MIDIAGREFSFVVGSDVQRDGMYLEVAERKDGAEVVVAEVFYSDIDHRMTFTSFLSDLPFEVIEYLGESARRRLTPINRNSEAAE